MNVLDENIAEGQVRELTRLGVRFRKVGVDFSRLGVLDQEIMPLLHQLPRPTFFTRDQDFYRPTLRHSRYCLVWLNVTIRDTATCIRRLLRHPLFDTEAKRLGHVIRASPSGLRYWMPNEQEEQSASWS